MNDQKSAIKRLAVKFKAVTDLIEQDLLTISKDGKKVSFYKVFWESQNKTFKKNWCVNIYMYCTLTYKLAKDVKIEFFDIEANKLIATFKNKKVRFF